MNDRQRQWLGAWLVFGGGVVFLAAVCVGVWLLLTTSSTEPEPEQTTVSTPAPAVGA
jgi:ABC-type transporter Mla subunit MlaD